VPGPRLVERLQSVRPGLKAVLMSGYTQAHMTEEERERLGVGFISKPIDPGEFVRRIRLYLDA
jgi:DNA-binding NtrC family response regulator